MPNYVSELLLKPSNTVVKIKDESAQNSITNLNANLQSEIDNRTNADSQLQGNIDNEKQARENADSLLQQNIDNLEDVVNNLDINHVYNQSTPSSGLTTNIGLKEGTYDITANTTINAQLVVPKGAIINIANGVTLTINGQILAGAYQIFSGNGTVVINNMSEIYPEWWGAKNDDTTDSTVAFTKAIASISKGTIVLQPCKLNIYTELPPTNCYVVNSTLVLNKNYVSFKGSRSGIKTTSNLLFEIKGSTDNGALNFVQGHYFDGIIFYYNGTPSGTGYNKKIAIKNHGSIRNVIKNCEFYNFMTAYYSDTIVANFFMNNIVHVPNVVYATGIYLNDNIINSAVYPNASQHVQNCTFLIGDNAVGITAIGDVLSDLYVKDCEFGGGYHAISMQIGDGSTSTKTSYNIHICDNICDNIANTCFDIQFGETYNSALNIIGNWIAHRDGNGITLQKVKNANISDNIINGTLGSTANGIALVYCENIIVKGNNIQYCPVAIDSAYLSLGIITDNILVFPNMSGHNAYTVAVRIPSSSGGINISNNSVRVESGATLTNCFIVQSAGNVINYNLTNPSIPDSIITGNIVNGTSI